MIGNVRGKKERGIVKKTDSRFRGAILPDGCAHLTSGHLFWTNGSYWAMFGESITGVSPLSAE